MKALCWHGKNNVQIDEVPVAENCGIVNGDTVAIWGGGPVAQFAMQSAWMLGEDVLLLLIVFRNV